MRGGGMAAIGGGSSIASFVVIAAVVFAVAFSGGHSLGEYSVVFALFGVFLRAGILFVILYDPELLFISFGHRG
ncbi:MAG TPA: hypothetical protein VKZ53_26000 [Candidatus Angelobacter sp.]|nr:hypothetical protein [Candidatus Angelobacter sp.]